MVEFFEGPSRLLMALKLMWHKENINTYSVEVGGEIFFIGVNSEVATRMDITSMSF